MSIYKKIFYGVTLSMTAGVCLDLAVERFAVAITAENKFKRSVNNIIGTTFGVVCVTYGILGGVCFISTLDTN